ncbi:Membrane protease YdiL, CAAX protease family [Saccharicrinis carchari]|uniref:Membrane protease YdiL, CAAX protease family n=1 Tax=Saccharicrinis carchari TaxID=1168039 RepID=A0A521F703_SACCC|nr:carboxypeptidase-like regulatory domain-containing protein [Saccharicrinis carchari]SMO91876.1 Membrane protease YdiL, CAAX protease family [Saccharicrinis carchari]
MSTVEQENQIIKKYKSPFSFYLLSLVIPWFLWFIGAYLSHKTPYSSTLEWVTGIIIFAGLLAPVIIALYFMLPDKELRKDFLGRFFNFRSIKREYILLTFFLMLLSILAAQAISLFFGYPVCQFELRGSFTFTSALFPVWFLLIISPMLEELAWHSYGTDSLVSRFNLFNASLIFAIYWAFWHFPLSFIKDYYHSNLVESGTLYSINFVVSLIPFVLIMNWLYYKTNRNILLVIVFHISAGIFNEIFATHPMSKVIQTGLLSLFAYYIITNDKPFFFSKESKSTNRKVNTISALKSIKSGFRVFILGVFLLGTSIGIPAQEITQTISGKVFDDMTNESLPFATIVAKSSDPLIGTVTDTEGNFVLENITVGRQAISISMIGYDTYEIKEIMVGSGQIINLNIGMNQSSTGLDEVVVRVNKSTALNSMATVSSRQFTVEETQRYAGGMDDPARLASSFAGVSNPSISDNGISIRGNNPDGLLWRIEGVEVPNPNHFANLTIAGGGLMSAISNQVMGNSDFFTGAFPAEYGNASSGVFDIKLREGNRNKKQYAFEAGILGVGAMAQGPMAKNSDASYIVNYRNSTMALLAPLLPSDAGVLKYQDLSFKTNFPTKKHGTFTLWGIGILDGIINEAIDSTSWESDFDRDNSKTAMYMYATALSHKISLPGNTFLKTSAAFTGGGLDFSEERLNYDQEAHPQSKAENNTSCITLQSEITKRFNENHSNKSGLRYAHHFYGLDVEESPAEGEMPVQIANQTGHTGFIQVFSQSKINVMPDLVLNAGINSQYLLLNKGFSVEPRVGVKYRINPKHNLGFAYGIHSRMEQLSVYFASVNGSSPNKNLDFTKSSHYVLSYHTKITDDLHLNIEPYYQQLKHVPLAQTGYVSTLNNSNNLFFNDALVSEGKGRNLGIDLTLEKFLSHGYYYMLTASVFDSKYTGADDIERNTRFNRNYVFNLLFGKEWQIRQNNILSANIRANYLGGNRIEPIDMEASMQQRDVVYGETGRNVAFSKKHDDLPVVSLTLSYRKNRTKYSSVWSLQVLNLNGAKEYARDFYNIKTNTLDTQYDDLVIPNISYKIEF